MKCLNGEEKKGKFSSEERGERILYCKVGGSERPSYIPLQVLYDSLGNRGGFDLFCCEAFSVSHGNRSVFGDEPSFFMLKNK